MPSPNQDLLRKLPSVDELLQDAELQKHAAGMPRTVVVDALRAAVEEVRTRLMEGAMDADPDAIRRETLIRTSHHIRSAIEPYYRIVINATGIILHTALGRAVLPSQAIRQVERELAGYSLLQADVESGRRSNRDGRIEGLLQQLTGAEAATLVNNNAAATMIVLNATAGDGGEVIVSRGQLVEIGGSFRLPEVMAASGARLVEVGTTNKTHPRDFENAITENTAAIMRVHPSNYKISGFTSEVSLEEMVRIAHDHDLPMIDDVGAGPLVDVSRFGFDAEPMLADSVRAGADLITASADKLIGSSQGGIILGKAKWVDAIRKNPLARTLRVGKLTLAVLEATLTLFLDEAVAMNEVPTLRMLRRSLAEIAEQAQRIAGTLRERTSQADITTMGGFSQMGSGSLPTQDLPTHLVAIRPKGIEAGQCAQRLRAQRTPVFTRVQKGQILIDPRTLLEGEEDVLIEALVGILEAGE